MKICPECNQSLDIGNFYAGRNTCKNCYNSRKKGTYRKIKKQAVLEEKRNKEFNMEMIAAINSKLDEIKAKNNSLNRASILEKINDLYELAQESMHSNVSVSIPIDIDDDLVPFLGNLDIFPHIKIAQQLFQRNRHNANFRKQYGIPDNYERCYDHFTQIVHIYDAIYQTYCAIQRDEIVGIDQEFVVPRLVVDPIGKTIYIKNNPLHISTKIFLDHIKEFIRTQDLRVQGFIAAGYYDRILNKFSGSL